MFNEIVISYYYETNAQYFMIKMATTTDIALK